MSNEVTIFDTDLKNKIAALLRDGVEPLKVCEQLSCTNPMVYEVKNSHTFATFCYNSAMQKLMTEGAIAAVDCLVEIVKDKKAGKNVRAGAADKLLHYTGLRVTESGNLERSPATMTQEEIHARLQALQSEAAQRSKSVNSVTIEGIVSRETSHNDPIDINNLL